MGTRPTMSGSPSTTGKPWAYGVTMDTMVFQCSSCAYSSCMKHHVATHLRSRCPGGELLSRKCTLPVLELGTTLPQTGGTTTATTSSSDHAITNAGNHNHNSTTTINVTVNVAAPAAPSASLPDLVASGSEEEKRMILDALFEDEALRAALERARLPHLPGLIFQATRGTRGPKRLRNVRKQGRSVRKQGRSVRQWTGAGAETSGAAKFSKTEAVTMMERLLDVLGCIYEGDPLYGWRQAVCGKNEGWTYGKKRFVDALRMRRDSDKAFYKLPRQGKEDVVECARGIEMAIDTEPL